MKQVEIENGQVFLNGNSYFEDQSNDFNRFAKAFFKFLAVDYPKFYKMDQQSKLAFLAAELLLKEENTLNENQEIALLFSNKNSSLEADFKHHLSIQGKEEIYPSPAVFVYTLANICLGEVSIRHQLKTESAFFITEDFEEIELTEYANYLIKTNRCKKAVIAWVDYLQDNYKTKMILIE